MPSSATPPDRKAATAPSTSRLEISSLKRAATIAKRCPRAKGARPPTFGARPAIRTLPSRVAHRGTVEPPARSIRRERREQVAQLHALGVEIAAVHVVGG